MEELDPYYLELLRRGLIVLRNAIYAKDHDWAKLEVEALHNLPGLIGWKNLEQHRWYWFVERELYLERVVTLKHDESILEPDEAVSDMQAYYMPIWEEMEPIVLHLLNNHESTEDILKENLPE